MIQIKCIILIMRYGVIYMEKNFTNVSIDLRSIERSPYRNREQKCMGCGYMQRPSSYGVCSFCHLNYFKKQDKR